MIRLQVLITVVLVMFSLAQMMVHSQDLPINCNKWSDKENACIDGCKTGFRGSFCNETCSDNCAGACSQDTGHCLTGCKLNWFTLNCSEPCSGHCVDDICDINSGECVRGCQDGYYGESCNLTCSKNCTDAKCDANGGCYCAKGITDKVCYIDCTENCKGGNCAVNRDGQLKCLQGCKDGRTGLFCKEWCLSDCASCDSEGVCQRKQEASRRKRDVSHCIDEDEFGNCNCCEDKWRGRDCDIPCPACRYTSINCTLVCAGGFFGEECHLFCPENCSRALNGRSGCDQRGLCHSGCLQGYYGYQCDRICPKTCDSRYCFMNNGSCSIGCLPENWGPYCENKCGHCVDLMCERNGSCTCMDGYYGPRCEDKCTDNCLSGNCSIAKGNHVCNGDCVPGYTGIDCLSRCPLACYNAKCDRQTGNCVTGGNTVIIQRPLKGIHQVMKKLVFHQETTPSLIEAAVESQCPMSQQDCSKKKESTTRLSD